MIQTVSPPSVHLEAHIGIHDDHPTLTKEKKKHFHFSFHPSPVSKKQVEKTEIATSSCHSVSVFLLGIEQSNLKRTV